MHDIVIRGGTVVDGSGSPGRRADIGIKGDRIVSIGDTARRNAKRTIDARGLMAITPGGDASTASTKGTGMFTGSTQSSAKDSFHDSQETLYTLASDTGGKRSSTATISASA